MMYGRRKLLTAMLAASASVPGYGEEWIRLSPETGAVVVQTHIDLRPNGALEALQRSNPRHFGQIRRVLVRMREVPLAGPGHWFPPHVEAKDLEFSELTFAALTRADARD